MPDSVRSYETLALSPRHLTGSELRTLRRQLGLSQAALADLFGVKELTVARWEKQQTKVSRCAEALLRLIYLEYIGKPVGIWEMLAKIMPIEELSDA